MSVESSFRQTQNMMDGVKWSFQWQWWEMALSLVNLSFIQSTQKFNMSILLLIIRVDPILMHDT